MADGAVTHHFESGPTTYHLSLRTNPLARSPGQVKLDSNMQKIKAKTVISAKVSEQKTFMCFFSLLKIHIIGIN